MNNCQHQIPGAPEEVGSPLRVALLGCGVVGSQVARILTTQTDELRLRVGRPLELVGIGVFHPDKERPGLDPALFTTDLDELVSRDDVDIVVEVIGGIEPAKRLIKAAMTRGKSVVTANKALLAEYGDELFPLAREHSVDLFFEAAVAGAIPIVRPLKESLVGDEILTVMGIVNGTTNYILDQMCTVGRDFNEALRQAKDLGYAEADPTADIEGFDAAAKAALLAREAFHTPVTLADVYREGITSITKSDVLAAKRLNCTIKLMAITQLRDEGSIEVRVHPAMIPLTHPLATVNGANNAIFVEAREAGRLMFMGPGAGGSPTASAVMGDLVTVARNLVRETRSFGETLSSGHPLASKDEFLTRYYVRMDIKDEPGVLARVAAIFAAHGISVLTVNQGASEDGLSMLEFTTHVARDAAMRQCVAEVSSSPVVLGNVYVLRVEGI